MFTGIVEAVGRIAERQPTGGDLRLRIASAGLPLDTVKLGDSIASNGVCLTVVECLTDGFWADLSRETLAHSTFSTAKVGDWVNLERAMAADGRFDGHIVSGHVDGIGTVVGLKRDARSLQLRVQAPEALARYIAVKGSMTVDGVSLTVNGVDGAVFALNIVPHTAAQTGIVHYTVGSQVNLEVDIIARYLERLLQVGQMPASDGLSLAKLADYGFLKAGH